ncbi:TetR/AcrR family transcriptional regulator, partial [Streptomyces sp. NPDC003832]
MSEPTGLRARKKERTRDAIGDAAVSLFLEHGFDRVSVNDIAAAAEISKPTLFRYFPTKEDLVLHRFADHQGEAARVVRGRTSGIEPVTALHGHFRAGLDRYDPVTGLNDHPDLGGGPSCRTQPSRSSTARSISGSSGPCSCRT